MGGLVFTKYMDLAMLSLSTSVPTLVCIGEFVYRVGGHMQ